MLIGGMLVRQILVDLGSSHQPVALLVFLDIYNVLSAAFHALFLFAEGAEEVFHQAPVEEGPVLVGPGHFQVGKLPHLGQRALGGGNDALVLVQIDEHFQLVAVVHLWRDVTLRQQDVAGGLVAFEVDAGIGVAPDAQGVIGAFVCGEETALIHSMEGKRGEPTFKPPFPAQSGYLQKPTNVNNVETLANIPIIIIKGADWFSSIGTEKSKGTKVFALAGQINNVGLIEVPMGTTLREIIYEIGGGIKGGREFKAVQTGGPSGGCLTSKHLDVAIDYDSLTAAGSMMGSGGMVVMDETSCMVSIAKFYLDFTVEESCGKCTPCRVGNKRLYEILDRITKGKGTMEDLDNLKNLSKAIKDTALCGLGQTAPNPVLSTIDNFWDEYVEHVQEHKCRAGACKALMRYEIDTTKCVGCTACARNCPVSAITGERKSPHTINQDACIKCGTCIDKCKFGAISIK